MKVLLLALVSTASVFAGTLTVTYAPFNLLGTPGSTIFLDGTISNGTSDTIFGRPGPQTFVGWNFDPSVVQAAGYDSDLVFLTLPNGPGLAPGASFTGHFFDFLIGPNPQFDLPGAASVFIALGPQGGPYTVFSQNGTVAATTPEPGSVLTMFGGVLLFMLRYRRTMHARR